MSSVDESEATRQQQAAIALTRHRVASEVDEIVDRFKPAVVKERAEARIAAELRELAAWARRRPGVAATIVALGLSFLAWRIHARATR
jgi:hypothetical protein